MVNRKDWFLPRMLPDPLQIPSMRTRPSRNLHESPFNSRSDHSGNDLAPQPPISQEDRDGVSQVHEPPHKAINVSAILRKQPPPGRYENEANVPRRPPLILEEAIKPFKETMISETLNGQNSLDRQSQTRKKDIHRYLRVVHFIGHYIKKHNNLHEGDPFMQYRWYTEDISASDITNTLFSIIEDRARSIVPHLYSIYTYNDAQRRDGPNMEALVASVAEDPMFDPLTQTVRVFGIRRLVQEKMASKKKSKDRRERRTGERGSRNREGLSVPVQGPSTHMPIITNPDLPTVSAAAIEQARTPESQRATIISPGAFATRLEHRGFQSQSQSRQTHPGNSRERELQETNRRGEDVLRARPTSHNAPMGNVSSPQLLRANMTISQPRSYTPISNAFRRADILPDTLNGKFNNRETNIDRVGERNSRMKSNSVLDNELREDTDVQIQIAQHRTTVRDDVVLPRRAQRNIPRKSIAVHRTASDMNHSELQSEDDSSSSEEDEEGCGDEAELVRLKKRLREIENRSLRKQSKKRKGRK